MEQQHTTDMSTEDKARLVAGFLHEKKGLDVLALDVKEYSSAAESMVILGARSGRQAQALADNLKMFARERKLEFFGMEGYQAAQWVLIDMNDVIIHIFQEDVRLHFNLEGLWVKAPVLVDHRGQEEAQ